MIYIAKLINIRHTIVIILAILLGLAESTAADSYLVRGIVRDSLTMEVVPHASVMAVGFNSSAVADGDGIFEISVPDATKALQITCVGYNKLILPIKRNTFNTYVAYVTQSTTELQELVVRKGKYSKRNNPAVDFLNVLKQKAPSTDPRRNPYYSYDKYERLVMGLNNFTPDDFRALSRRISDIGQHVDTSEISEKPYLSLLVKEKAGRQHYRHRPAGQREVIEAVRGEGIDDMIDPVAMRTFMEDILRDVDLYQNDINLLQNRFVSPLSVIAPDFYKFYLTDTVDVGGQRCVVLSFYPHNHSTFGFMGHVYVVEGDSSMFIKRVEMHVPREINLNFVDNLYITQEFEKAPDGSRLKLSDDLIAELSLTGSGSGVYLCRRSAFRNHSFDEVADSVFDGGGALMLPGAAARDSAYWDNARFTPINRGEKSLGSLMADLRRIPLYYWGEKIVRLFFTGYIPTGNPSPFDIGPVNAMASYNSVEGLRLRLGGMTMSELSPRWFARAYGAYGFKDHRWKYGFELEYSFIDKAAHSREFPVKSIRLNSSYDVDRPGQRFRFTSSDNFVLSLKRMSDDRAVYKRFNSLKFVLENSYNFSVEFALSNTRYTPSATMGFVNGHGVDIGHIDENAATLSLRYAPGEKFVQTRTYRLPVNLDAPAITLSHTFAPKGFAGAQFGVNVTELNLAKRWWFSAFGFLDTYLTAGQVWGQTTFMNLLTPNANLSYIIIPQTFALLNPMEFVNSSYVALDLTYRANGCIFNYVPVVKKLKLREVFCFRGFLGVLNDKNNPRLNPALPQLPVDAAVTKLDRGPYMEASVGIENIFKVLRIDYVWRLNYRNVPYSIDRSGLRIAVVVTF